MVGNAIRSAMVEKKTSLLGNVLPTSIIKLIKDKRKFLAIINLANSERRKRKEHQEGTKTKLLCGEVLYRNNMNNLKKHKRDIYTKAM